MIIWVDYFTFLMFKLVRKVVAGPKRTTKYEGLDLDLTYISERIIAMAFPASRFIQQTYRNKIQDVSSYLSDHHPQHYLIFNVSSRSYDYQLFQGRVKEFQWPDHQVPPLTTLFSVANEMFNFLSKNSSNVVAVHCNHGKGRTGTAIIAFFLLIGYSDSASECLKYYNFRRFNKETYGVDQPCQVRYLNYLEKLVKSDSVGRKLKCLHLRSVTQKGLDQRYYVRIKSTRTQQNIYERIHFNTEITQLPNRFLISDIFIELFMQNWMGDKRISRINYNLYFLNDSLELVLRGSSIKVQNNHSTQFQIVLTFEYHCLCHLPAYYQSCCKCNYVRSVEEMKWRRMVDTIVLCKQLTLESMSVLVHGQSDLSNEETAITVVNFKKPLKGSRKKRTNRYKKIDDFMKKQQAKKLLLNNFI